MKTKTFNLTTNKSIAEISDIMRKASAKLRANINGSEMRQFRDICFQKADITIALSGANSIFGGPRKWGVQVFITDNYDTRSIELVAVGDEISSKLLYGSFGNPFFELRDSVERMQTIIKMIEK